MPDDDPKIIKSKFCQKITQDGLTVSVEIYRLENSSEWTLELVDSDWNSTVWEDPFPTDLAAWEAFRVELRDIGLARLLEDEPPPTVH